MGEVKFVLSHYTGWLIAKLVDGQIGGRFYHYQIRTGVSGSYGHKVIVNSGKLCLKLQVFIVTWIVTRSKSSYGFYQGISLHKTIDQKRR